MWIVLTLLLWPGSVLAMDTETAAGGVGGGAAVGVSIVLTYRARRRKSLDSALTQAAEQHKWDPARLARERAHAVKRQARQRRALKKGRAR